MVVDVSQRSRRDTEQYAVQQDTSFDYVVSPLPYIFTLHRLSPEYETDNTFAILYHKLSVISSDFSEFAIIYKKLTAEHHTLRSSFLIIISFIFFFACAEPSRYNRQIKRDRQYECRNTVVGLNKNIKGRMEQYRCDKE